jgi:hypothetical protein
MIARGNLLAAALPGSVIGRVETRATLEGFQIADRAGERRVIVERPAPSPTSITLLADLLIASLLSDAPSDRMEGFSHRWPSPVLGFGEPLLHALAAFGEPRGWPVARDGLLANSVAWLERLGRMQRDEEHWQHARVRGALVDMRRLVFEIALLRRRDGAGFLGWWGRPQTIVSRQHRTVREEPRQANHGGGWHIAIATGRSSVACRGRVEQVMTLIVGVHGIAQQLKAAPILDDEWWPSLTGGVSNAGRTIPDRSFKSAFYGNLFRPPATVRASDFNYQPSDVEDGFEQELLHEWWIEAASAEPQRVVPPGATVRAGTPSIVQAALRALSRSSFFVNVAQPALIGNLKQVRRYLSEPAIRDAAQRSVNDIVTSDTRLIVAHSLGSVVIYEALHRWADAPNWQNVRTLITLGSPLGISNLIFSRLNPAPVDNKGPWPTLLERWTNLSADNDVVALQKKLAPLFDDRVVDLRIDNEARAHDVSPYLTDAATGAAIADALA